MRLLNAEILKLRKRRGLMIWAGLLTIGSVVIAYGVTIALHAANPAKHGPAGGAANLQDLMWLLASLGGVAAVLIGTTAGSQDTSAGVFRDLVVTGRLRRTLFRVRFPGALAVYVPLLATGFVVAVAGAYAFAGGTATPTAHDIARYAAAVGSLGVVNLALGVALGSMIPPRIATGVLIGWNSILASLLVSITALGGARTAIDLAAAMHFAPAGAAKGVTVPMTGSAAAIVLLIWIGAALRAGELWTRRVEA